MSNPPIDVINGLKLATSGFDRDKSYYTRLPGVEDELMVYLYRAPYIQNNKNKFRVVFYEEPAQFHNSLGVFKIGIVDRAGKVMASVVKTVDKVTDSEVVVRTLETSYKNEKPVTQEHRLRVINNRTNIVNKISFGFLNSVKRAVES